MTEGETGRADTPDPELAAVADGSVANLTDQESRSAGRLAALRVTGVNINQVDPTRSSTKGV
jgi:hypothetical protein